MTPYSESQWWIESSQESIDSDIDSAILAVRLGLSVNAFRAQLRWHASVFNGSGAVNAVDFFLSVLACLAYTREALNILTGTGKVRGQAAEVRTLARRANIASDVEHRIIQLRGGPTLLQSCSSERAISSASIGIRGQSDPHC